MDIHIRGRKKAWLKKDTIMKENNIKKNPNLLQPSSEQFLAAMSPARRKKVIRRNCFRY